MKKKIFAILITFILMSSMLVFAEANETLLTEKEQKSIDFVTTFDIIKLDDENKFNPEAKITRGELAQIICSIFNLSMSNSSTWYEEVFKESNANISLDSVTSEELLFTDLKNTHEYYSYIETAFSMGILHGNDKNEFLPDSFVTYDQFNKVMVALLGYSIKAEGYGGYPYGYNKLANELRLTSGIQYSGNKEMTRKDMAVEIFNAIDVDIMRITTISDDGYSYETNNGEKFINILGLKKVMGQITANSDTTLYGSSGLLKNTVRIGNEVFTLSEKTYSLSEYIGREVEAYASNDVENTIQTIFLYFLSGKDRAVTISMEDFLNFSNNTLNYKDNDSKRSLKIKPGATLIKNRSFESTYDNNTFLFDCGTITLISSNSSNIYDLIIIEGYDSIYVSNVDYEGKILYDKFKGKTPAYNFKSYEEEKIEVYKNGETVTFEAIKMDDFLDISAGKNSVRIYISNNTVKNFSVSEITQKDGVTIYSNGTDFYSASNDYISYPDKKSDIIGSIGTLYLNKFNQIVWFSEGESDTRMYAYLIASKPSDNVFGDGVDIQLYDYNSGTIKELKLKSTLNFDAPDGKVLKKPSIDIYNSYLNNYNGTIRYKLSTQNEVNYIEMPISLPGVRGETGRLYDMFAINGWASKTKNYYKESVGNGLFFVKDAEVLQIPSEESYRDEEVYYKKGKPSQILATSRDYDFDAYTTEPDTIVADFITVKGNSNVNAGIRDFGNFAVVKDISIAYKDEAIAKKITLITVPTQDMTSFNEFEVYDKEEGAINIAGQKCMYSDCAIDAIKSTDSGGNIREYSLVPGDIIAYDVDEYDYLISSPIVIYKSDMYNPYVLENERGKLGWLAGTMPKWESGVTNGNPIVYENGSILTWANGTSYTAGSHRIAFGYPIMFKNGTYKLTTQDLSNGSIFSANGMDGLYRVRDYLYTSYGCTITIKDGDVNIKKISPEDLRTYEYYNKDCSQVINMLNYGGTKTMIIINRD